MITTERASNFISMKRVIRKTLLIISRSPWIPSSKRWYIIRWGGVNIKGPCFIGEGIKIDTIRPDLITIEAGACITAGTCILSHFHKGDAMYYGEVHIGKNVFIGLNTIIANAVSIRDKAVIGAGSIVTKDIPAEEIWAGNPAKFIKKRDLSDFGTNNLCD